MTLPTPLKILLLDQVVLIIENAANVSRKDFLWYPGDTYRNTLTGHKLELKPNNGAVETYTTDTLNLQVPGTPGAATLVNSPAGTQAGRAYIDDVASAIAPHFRQAARTRVEFWSDEIGLAMTLTVGTTDGSATVTVSDNSRVRPGQAISGTGIPAGTTVEKVPTDSLTTLILSQMATATGAEVAATLTGSDYLGGYWEDEAVGEGAGVEILQ